MTRHYPDLGSASDWLNQISHAARPITSTTQIWVVTRHQNGISALVLRSLPVVASPNVGCFLRLEHTWRFHCIRPFWVLNSYLYEHDNTWWQLYTWDRTGCTWRSFLIFWLRKLITTSDSKKYYSTFSHLGDQVWGKERCNMLSASACAEVLRVSIL